MLLQNTASTQSRARVAVSAETFRENKFDNCCLYPADLVPYDMPKQRGWQQRESATNNRKILPVYNKSYRAQKVRMSSYDMPKQREG